MTQASQTTGPALELDVWMSRRRTRVGGAAVEDGPDVRRFAFYGRTSTSGYQDRSSSWGWQREMAEALVSGRGCLVKEFFDVGCSRRSPWARRPRAAALLAAAGAGEFDAVVVGEYERAFASNAQFAEVAAALAGAGVEVWLPEAGGRVDTDSLEHRALLTMLGAQSQREVLRTRHRVLAAMQTQTREQGRYLGGRPPYGYRLVDAGPHPNPVHAQWGRRVQRLVPDPVTAPHVRWMFAQRRARRSVASIARELTERGVPCPSEMDPDRNPHRSTEAWSLRTVSVILGNPRYTGRQVWNRHSSDRNGVRDVHRSTTADEWAVSSGAVHPPLVGEAEFVAVQDVRAARPAKDGSRRRYVLSGLVRCGMCGRRLDAHWVHGRAGYRCRHGRRSASPRESGGASYLYVREDVLIAELGSRSMSGGSRNEDEAATVSWLRGSGMIVVHRGSDWSLEPG